MSKETAKIFANEWYYSGNEIGDYQIFWLTLLRDVFGVDKPERFITFQKSVNGKHIDAYIARTKVLIEHKTFGDDLSKKFLQSDGELLTPFEQAKRYADMLPANEKPRWIVTCNFAEFRIYDLHKNLFDHTATVIKLRDLRYKFQRLRFLIDPTADDRPPEEKISKDAAQIIEKICLAFDEDYRKREPAFRDALSKFCTRLVFCFYADDSDIFKANKFNDYLQKFSPEKLHDALQNFFDVLNTPDNLRGNIEPALKNFPYVNGGLFDEKLDIPPLNENLKLTIERAHVRTLKLNEDGVFIKFSWHEIDPPIFGAMFESVVGSQREGGMYYTSVDNIHKVIDPLFIDDLHEEFVAAKNKRLKNRPQALFALQDKLAALKFLDPACGSGNFLTETYLSLRRLENEILE
ncbi:MAG: class I SAM-dependent DNA methyltransferase, partial [Selenomonadaceae bacterium]|nr:class I SAM-dependent DNA methyltransferase [Selenomonadaceae bacterium]